MEDMEEAMGDMVVMEEAMVDMVAMEEAMEVMVDVMDKYWPFSQQNDELAIK